MTRGLFITGTNTGVGKSYAGALIAKQLFDAGYKVGVYKPAESGCEPIGEELIASDANLLWNAAGRPGEIAKVCPQKFAAPLAPPSAAAEEGKTVDEEMLREGFDYWRKCSDIVLVEGAGGLMSPISDEDYNIDLAKDLGLPLVIVSVNELGTINATLQTVITARALAPELPIAGIILNQKSLLEDDPSIATNGSELSNRATVPVLACIGFDQAELRDSIDWLEVASTTNT